MPFLLIAASASAALPPGRPLPDLPVLLTNGRQLDLKQYRGNAVLLVIFSTTCHDCEETITLLDKMYPDYTPRGLRIVAAAVEPEAARMVSTWLVHQKKQYPVGYLDLDPYRKIANVTIGQNVHVPILMFIDAKGMVRVQFFGDDPLLKTAAKRTILATTDELLKEVPPANAKR